MKNVQGLEGRSMSILAENGIRKPYKIIDRPDLTAYSCKGGHSLNMKILTGPSAGQIFNKIAPFKFLASKEKFWP